MAQVTFRLDYHWLIQRFHQSHQISCSIYLLQILDNVIASRSYETLNMLTIIILLTILFGLLLELTRRQILISWGSWIERFFGPILLASGLKKGDSYTMRTTNILRDVKIMRSFVVGKAFIAWLDLIWAPVFVVAIFMISPPLSYVLAFGTMTALLLAIIDERIARKAQITTYKAGRDDQDWIAAAERNHETLGSLNVVTNFVRRWHNTAFVRLDETMRARLVNIYFETMVYAIGIFVRITSIVISVGFVIREEMSVGMMVAVNLLVHVSFNIAQEAANRWRDVMLAKNSYMRVKAALKRNTETTPVSIPKSDQPVPLIIEDVSYRYPNQPKHIFKKLNLTLNPGDALFVIGPSASGKTTFSRLVSGLLAPRSGNIRLGDVSVYQFQKNTVLRAIGNLAQDTTLFRGSVRENIASMSEGDINKVIKAAKMAGVHDIILMLPDGYDTFIVEYEPLLSSGQRKAIALARAFYDNPALIVLDEPIPHLDKSTRSALFKTFEQLKAEGTVLVVTTQSKVPSKYADKVIMFDGDQGYKVFLSQEEIESLRSSNRGRRKHHQKKTSSKTSA